MMIYLLLRLQFRKKKKKKKTRIIVYCSSLYLAGAQDSGLGVNLHFELADQNETYQEVLGSEFPEDHFVIAGMDIGYSQSTSLCSKRLPLDETTRSSPQRARNSTDLEMT